MRKAFLVLLLAVLCCRFNESNGQLFGPGKLFDFSALFEGINKMGQQLQHGIDDLNKRIREGVEKYFSGVEAFHHNLQKDIGMKMPTIMEPGFSNSIVISKSGGETGATRTVFSGYTPDGKPYYRDSERRIVNGVLHQSERVYDPVAQKINEIRYTLDLKDPTALPIEIMDTVPKPKRNIIDLFG